ncbi:unnamed protein product [Durusdinium trenchii]|uniref:Uncharacterized protein n=2 Tax=Durusdinium trenchii TaxID=1381693 RepID=A0ABP0SMU3_9DINO
MAARAAIHLRGNYEVGDMLGEGFGGFVYACHRYGDQKALAAKVCAARPGAAEELRSEAQLLRSLCHSSIMKVHDVFDDGKSVYFVMDRMHHDLLDGLENYVMREASNLNGLRHVVRQMAAAVKYLHSHSIVHRDIKPENFMTDRASLTDPECRLVLGDFGSACQITEQTTRLAEQVGTMVYWAPEMYDKDYGLKVDVWALGVCLHCVASNAFPFVDEQEVRTKSIGLSNINRACRGLISSMLEKVEEIRINMEDVVWHPWLTQETATEEPDFEALPPPSVWALLPDVSEWRLPSFPRKGRKARRLWPLAMASLMTGIGLARMALRFCPGWDSTAPWKPTSLPTVCLKPLRTGKGVGIVSRALARGGARTRKGTVFVR